ncbi:PilX N-terminal domain-containing pilus assembly protein [Cupriavidus sp. SW-Y-13]|uniref:pilus assembly PilX family protein n=1 Tax=Cupriavidus sp. SW-Y-13 TaxID=2653854 RepID=UPI0013657305|nr:PilX N-terminal domain-containing pilus assembly protein [Cupriavidus sp. SW-Y-13]
MSLILVLLLLVILTLAGLAASTMSLNSERLARNTRDESIALQAAESALRDARTDISKSRKLNGLTGSSPTCDLDGFKGYCQYATSGKQVWDLYIEDPARSVELGEMTGLAASQKMPTIDAPGAGANGVSRQPRYLIEPLKEPTDIEFGSNKYVYRVTAIGYGANPSTKVMVQEVVRF